MSDLEDLISRLIQHDVEFVVVGGFAAVAHGVSLLTQDIDVCLNFTVDNMVRLQEALRDLKPIHRMTPDRLPFDKPAEKCAALNNLYLDTDMGQLDCLSEVKSIGSFDEVKDASVTIELKAGICRILSLDALITAKEAMDRPRDREAVSQLKAIRDQLANNA